MILCVNKVHDGFLERCNRSEMTVFQALDKDFRSIPGLYAAFHTASGAVGENIASISLLGDCNLAYTSGYIAGESATLKG